MGERAGHPLGCEVQRTGKDVFKCPTVHVRCRKSVCTLLEGESGKPEVAEQTHPSNCYSSYDNLHVYLS